MRFFWSVIAIVGLAPLFIAALYQVQVKFDRMDTQAQLAVQRSQAINLSLERARLDLLDLKTRQGELTVALNSLYGEVEQCRKVER